MDIDGTQPERIGRVIVSTDVARSGGAAAGRSQQPDLPFPIVPFGYAKCRQGRPVNRSMSRREPVISCSHSTSSQRVRIEWKRVWD